MNWPPLQFPPQWPDIRRRSFLLGIPFIGPQAGAYENLCKQLQVRTAECWALWGTNECRRRKAAQFVANIVGEELRWPNPIFIPDDPTELVFWNESCATDDLCVIPVFVKIEMTYNRCPLEDEEGRLAQGTFGSYVDFLIGANGPSLPTSYSLHPPSI